MMNLFRMLGDFSHVMSIVVLLLRLRVTKNATGISIKTQELYLLVFIARYLDLFTTFYSVRNWPILGTVGSTAHVQFL
jgi:ER lumen protein retaining receptor